MQHTSDSPALLTHIIHIFRSVLEKELQLGGELQTACAQFLEAKLHQFHFDSAIARTSEILLHSKNPSKNSIKTKREEQREGPRDYFGDFYQKKLSPSEKKEHGIVYTPQWISRKMVNDAFHFLGNVNTRDIACLDPCCGTGIFLLDAFWHSYSLISPEQRTLDALSLLLQHIMGVDRDPLACLCATLNIFLLVVSLDPRLAKELQQRPNIVRVNVQDFLLEEIDRPTRKDTQILIIGNPPYVFLRNLSASEKSALKGRFSSSTRQFDTYGLFFERALGILPLGGIVSLVIPDSVLTLQNRQRTRELLLQRSHILKICRVGDIFPGISVASVVITAQKVLESTNGFPFSTEIEDLTRGENVSPLKVSQDAFIQAGSSFAPAFAAESHSIIAFLRKGAMSIAEYNKTRETSEQVNLARGIEIGKSGNVVECPRCHAFFPQPKNNPVCPYCQGDLKKVGSIFFLEGHEIPLFSRTDIQPVILGLTRWRCGTPHLVVRGLPGIKYKDARAYTESRVVIRQLLQNGRCCAALPPGRAMTTQSVYNLNLPLSLHPLEILAVLNSNIVAAAAYELFSNGKKLFPRILLHVLTDLPIIPRNSPPESIRNSLQSLVQQFIANPALDADKRANEQLDQLVLNYLGCAGENQHQIHNAVREFSKVIIHNGRP